MRRLVILLLFISTILANPRIRGYHSILLSILFIIIKLFLGEALTATFSSPYDYDVIENPLQITVSFSQDVTIFDSHDCVVMNDFFYVRIVSECKSKINFKTIIFNISNHHYPRKARLLIHFLITFNSKYNK